jgi:hypothetical protein
MLSRLKNATILGFLGLVTPLSAMLIDSNYKEAPDLTQQKQVALSDGSAATQVQFVAIDDAGVAPALDVNLIYETKSGLIWWNFSKAGRVNQSDITQLRSVGTKYPWLISRTSDSRSLVGFLMSGLTGARLTIVTSQASAKSLSMAKEMSLDSLSKASSKIVEGTAAFGTELDLASSLGKDFFYTQFDASPISKARIGRVVASKDGWDLDLVGANSQTAAVSLSSDFRIVKAVVKN